MWRVFDVITGRAIRRARREARAEWCRIRLDDEGVDIEVRERPVWHDRVAWTEILAVGEEPDGPLGPGLNLFIGRAPGVVWASLDGSGAQALVDELRRRRVPFRPVAELWRELDERLTNEALAIMRQRFPPADWPVLERELYACRGGNVGRTRVALVRLANGSLDRFLELAADARRDSTRIVDRDIAENVSRE